MNKLSRAQLDAVTYHILQTKPHQALQAELVDHIASLIEQRIKQGQAFPEAFEQVMQQANPQALGKLRQLYLQEFTVAPSAASLMVSRSRLRSQRRTSPQSFQYMLLSSVLTFLVLMLFIALVSRPFAVPVGTFQMVFVVGLAGVMGVFMARWWTTRRLRKPKRFQTA